MRKKIAFVHYPNAANSARLETMPFALNSVIALAKAGWNIELYLWEKPSSRHQELLPENIVIKYFSDPLPSPIDRLRPFWLRFRFQWQNGYRCVFGLGQIGAYIAATIARRNRCPFIYLNDEFPSQWNGSWWTRFEKKVSKEAAMIVVPDSQRFQPLCQELEISDSTPYAALPNIAVIKEPLKEIDWHTQLGLPDDSIPFLHAGSIADWSCIPELLTSVPYWPEKAVLILHSRSREAIEKYRQQLSHLEMPGKVFWSYEPLSENQLNSLVAYCVGNFALYRNLGPNIEYMGFSSGKLMRSLACGSPVIASSFSSLSFVEEYQLGILVRHPSEIPKAVETIILDRLDYKQRCSQFCDKVVSFDKIWEEFCDKLMQTTHIDLFSIQTSNKPSK